LKEVLVLNIHTINMETVFSLRDSNQIALTFDDGPKKTYTEDLLSILKEHDAKATFFLIGKNAEQHRDIVQKIYQAGHSIGNHSYSHVDLSIQSASEVDRQLKGCQLVLAETIQGWTPTLFRAPYGRTNIETINAVKTLGLKIIYWSCDPKDYLKGCTATKLFTQMRGTIETTTEGQIVLLHDGHEDKAETWRTNRTETLKAVKMLLEEYSGERRFVALS
jgi:peptidoglycan/xylan/chitin deacetylase (PgdA/CDA1 family)